MPQFGDYELAQKIAEGGMAELFLAKRRGAEGFEKIVAIKRILPELSWNKEFVSMFINEAKIAARLNHPNIVQIFDFGKIDDYYFIAMEYVAGENLRSIQTLATERDLQIPQDIAAFMIAKAAAGLEHAHKKMDETGRPLHIVHRDVSPQNILLSYEGDVKVVDFGIAKAVAENPEATKGVLKGKLSYLSPEQVAGKSLDGRSDVFSLGLVLYELVAGEKLFNKNDPAETLDGIMNIDSAKVAKQIPNASKPVREAIRRSLHVDPDERYASAGELQRALEDYLRTRTEWGGTMQLQNFMRLLYDESIGDKTTTLLRSEVIAATQKRRFAGLPSGPSVPKNSKRLFAGLGGAVAGVLTVALVAPEITGSTGDPPERPTPAPTEVPVAAVDDPPPGSLAAVTVPDPPPPPPTRAAADPPPPRVDATAAALESALAATKEGRFADAVAAFEIAFEGRPNLGTTERARFGEALVGRATELVESEPRTSERLLRRAIEIDGDGFDSRFLLAKVLTEQGSTQLAAAQYREAIRIRPDSADAHFNLGYLHFTAQEYDKAVTEYRKTASLRPPYVGDVYFNLAVCYEYMGRRDDAIRTLEEGLRAAPDAQMLADRLRQLRG